MHKTIDLSINKHILLLFHQKNKAGQEKIGHIRIESFRMMKINKNRIEQIRSV